MAFKMNNKPIIAGSQEHKSALKAKKNQFAAPVASGSDAALVQAGKELGLSKVPFAIDYGIKYDPKLKFNKNKTVPPKEEENNKENANNTEQISLIKVQTLMPQLVQTGDIDRDQALAINNSISNVRKTRGEDKFISAAEEFFGPMTDASDLIVAEERMQYNNDTDSWEMKPIEKYATIDVEPLKQIPITQPNETVIAASNYKPKPRNYADQNPKYQNLKNQDGDLEVDEVTGRINIDQPSQPGYNLDVRTSGEGDQANTEYVLQYNGHDIKLNELSPEAYEQLAPIIIDLQESNENVNNQTQPVITNEAQPTVRPPVKPIIENPRFNMRKYKWNNGTGGFLPGGKEQYEKDLEQYDKQVNTKDSAAQMRDDKIYNNAIPGGPVQMNMIKNGYVPK